MCSTSSTAARRSFGPDELHAAYDFVTALAHEHGRSKSTGREWKTLIVDVFTLRDNKIAKLCCAYDTAAVAEAFWTPTVVTEPTAQVAESARA
jgi:hypothetical protein